MKDSGPGIPENEKARIFEKLYTSSGPRLGFGLGLTFCKYALAAHGGTIWVESDGKRGSVFRFVLPAKK